MNRKPLSEAEILSEMRQPGWGLAPLLAEVQTIEGRSTSSRMDAFVVLRWKKRSYRFGVEIKGLWTPKIILQAVDQVERAAAVEKVLPMIVVPYLADERLSALESRGVSGIDLCGNGVVIVPGEILVLRTGNPNRFRFEAGIKNVYRGTSSLVARALLLEGGFRTTGDALERIRALGGKVTLPTVSKVCKALEDDLIIERLAGEALGTRSLRLLQPEKLLDLLRDNYTPPKITAALTGKYTGFSGSLIERLAAAESGNGGKVVRTGATSVDAYAVMVREPVQELYCSNLAGIRVALGEQLQETERFPNLRLLETRDPVVYFDRRLDLRASPIQTYLELAVGEKRDQETAEQVRRLILRQQTDRDA